MRTPRSILLVQLLIAAGCTAPGYSESYAPVAQDPAPGPPRLPGSGPKEYYVAGDSTGWSGQIGVGTIDFKAPGTVLNDHTTTRELKVGIDGAADLPSGPAMQLRAFLSGTELFDKVFISDGVMPQRANAQAFGIQAFPHLRIDTATGQSTMPLRVGTFVDYLGLEHESANIDRSWLTFGVRVEAEPRITLTTVNGVGIDLFGRVGGDVGYAWFREEYVANDDTDETYRWGYHAGLGLGWHEDNWTIDIGYEFGQIGFDATDTGLLGARDSVRVEHQRVFLGGSVLL